MIFGIFIFQAELIMHFKGNDRFWLSTGHRLTSSRYILVNLINKFVNFLLFKKKMGTWTLSWFNLLVESVGQRAFIWKPLVENFWGHELCYFLLFLNTKKKKVITWDIDEVYFPTTKRCLKPLTTLAQYQKFLSNSSIVMVVCWTWFGMNCSV